MTLSERLCWLLQCLQLVDAHGLPCRDDTHAPKRPSPGRAQVSSRPESYARSKPDESERSRWRLRGNAAAARAERRIRVSDQEHSRTSRAGCARERACSRIAAFQLIRSAIIRVIAQGSVGRAIKRDYPSGRMRSHQLMRPSARPERGADGE
jgi:hypothetical protein